MIAAPATIGCHALLATTTRWTLSPAKRKAAVPVSQFGIRSVRASMTAAVTAIIPPFTSLGFAPKIKGSLAIDYRARLNGPVDLFFSANGNYQSSQLSLFAADPFQRQFGTIKAYGLVNLALGVGDKADRFRVTAQVRNLFDTSYAAAIVNGGPGGSYRYQIPRDADRYYGLTARVNF